jgi:hypothetical protein
MASPSTRRLVAFLPVVTICGTVNLFAQNAPPCQRVEGFLEETLVPPPTCTSSVGLCTVARMFGDLKGQARFSATALVQSADTPTTAVIFVTGDTVVDDAKVANKRGTLLVKNAAAYRTVGNGDLVDNQTIVGGTGEFVGASGSLRISGHFLAETGGVSRFEGMVCVP